MNEKITAKITGVTFRYLGNDFATVDNKNVKVVDVFQWDALNVFFSDEMNIKIIEDSAINEVPEGKNFVASIPLELTENPTKYPGITIIYEFAGPITFEVTGDFDHNQGESGFTNDENNEEVS